MHSTGTPPIAATSPSVSVDCSGPKALMMAAAGRAPSANVPAGTYHLKAWHERLPSQRQEITVPENGEVKVDFTLGIKGLPKI